MADVLQEGLNGTPKSRVNSDSVNPPHPRAANVNIPPPSRQSTDRPYTSNPRYTDTSPVNQNGSFAYDRVLKCGAIQKRTRKTKAWRKGYLVLRPNVLSFYKTEQEDRLRHQIDLADLTAVARLKHPKRAHVFGLFTPSRNYHIEASSDEDAQEWVEIIRSEARIDEEENEILLSSPSGHGRAYKGFQRRPLHSDVATYHRANEDLLQSSSPERDLPTHSLTTTRDGIRIPNLDQLPQSPTEHFGLDIGSYSSLSDAAPGIDFRGSSLSLSRSDTPYNTSAAGAAGPTTSTPTSNQKTSRPPSPTSSSERILWQGHLWCLKTKGGVRQWKKLWTVLRAHQISLYKNEDEYAAVLLIPMSTIVNAVEIDPVTKSKPHCMQLIAEDKSWRFCAADEDSLAKWLGALKSLLARRKEELKRVPLAK
ncbi:MAG: hypothetical protein M1825_001986 [Sarcosagium campestre]|nr:MAG: hypothetical protein M1825_001986 [Sarcosagium campestre]